MEGFLYCHKCGEWVLYDRKHICGQCGFETYETGPTCYYCGIPVNEKDNPPKIYIDDYTYLMCMDCLDVQIDDAVNEINSRLEGEDENNTR